MIMMQAKTLIAAHQAQEGEVEEAVVEVVEVAF